MPIENMKMDATKHFRTGGFSTKFISSMAGVAELLERSRAHGPLRNVPMGFVVSILNSLADATMDFKIHDPINAKKLCKVGFEALWRVIA